MYYISNLESIMDTVIGSVFLILVIIVFRILFEVFLSKHRVLSFLVMALPYMIVFFDIVLFVFMFVF